MDTRQQVGTSTREQDEASIATAKANYFGVGYNYNSYENRLDRDMKFCSYGIQPVKGE